jgi:type I protein arginine methyltransferase
MYSLFDFGRMLTEPRVAAYTEAMRRAIRPRDVVVDIGTGTGFFALVAAKLGARKVYAIEGLGHAAQLAKATVRDNGFSDVIEVVHGLSTELELAEKADVVVADLRGRLPLFGANVPSMLDARVRLLKPEGRLLPKRDHVYVSAFESDALCTYLLGGYEQPGFDLRACRAAVTQGMLNDDERPLTAEQLVAKPALLFSVEYGTSPDRYKGKVTLTATRPATIHGLVLWFDAEIDDAATFSNAPGENVDVYGRVVFAWDVPVTVAAGENLDVEVLAHPVKDDYLWSVVTRTKDRVVRQSPLSLSNFETLRPSEAM